MAGIDLRTFTIVDILGGLDAGDFTSEELTRAYLAQIARYEGVYNAFTFLAPDALAQVRMVCQLRCRQRPTRCKERIADIA